MHPTVLQLTACLNRRSGAAYDPMFQGCRLRIGLSLSTETKLGSWLKSTELWRSCIHAAPSYIFLKSAALTLDCWEDHHSGSSVQARS